MVVEKSEEKTGVAKIASDRRLAQLLFAQMCPQFGEPMISRLWSGNRTSPGGRTLLEMTHTAAGDSNLCEGNLSESGARRGDHDLAAHKSLLRIKSVIVSSR